MPNDYARSPLALAIVAVAVALLGGLAWLYSRIIRRTFKQQSRVDEALNIGSKQQARFETLISRDEDRQQRMDALIAKWENMTTRAESLLTEFESKRSN